jgi:DNA-binding Lrp family transcriptional regulator
LVELDNLDVRILTHLLENSRKSFQELAKQCLTTVPTVRSRVDRLIDLGIIRKFTIDLDNSMLGLSEAILIVSTRPDAVSSVSEELIGLDEVRELYQTSDSEAAIVCRISGNVQNLFTIQDRINLSDVNNIRVIPVKSSTRKRTLPLTAQIIAVTCSYCGKKVTEGAVRKKFEDIDYFFCCTTCLQEFEEKYKKMSAKTG